MVTDQYLLFVTEISMTKLFLKFEITVVYPIDTMILNEYTQITYMNAYQCLILHNNTKHHLSP